MTRQAVGFVLIGAFPLFLAGCGQQSTPRTTSGTPETYVPGLGDIMSLQQMRHVKLWFAGQAENWDLAAYEVDELTEGFDDVVKFHPTHKDSPVAPKDAIPRMVTEPLTELRAAINKKDSAAFTQAYDALTSACNNCHQATNFGFNTVQTPTANPYPNQVFTRAK
jgi:hypothetical protein